MGALCCCFGVDDDDIEELPIGQAALNFLPAYLSRTCRSFFRSGEVHPGSSSAPPAFIYGDNFACDTYRSPPRPLAFDDPRLQHQNLITRQEKASSHCHEDPDTLRSRGVGVCPVGTPDKWNDLEKDNVYELQSSESSLKKPPVGMPYNFALAEDEDTCPICLEEYTPENPCITLQCSHEYHLGCLYEWMERSDNCPICGKVILFDETE